MCNITLAILCPKPFHRFSTKLANCWASLACFPTEQWVVAWLGLSTKVSGEVGIVLRNGWIHRDIVCSSRTDINMSCIQLMLLLAKLSVSYKTRLHVCRSSNQACACRMSRLLWVTVSCADLCESFGNHTKCPILWPPQPQGSGVPTHLQSRIQTRWLSACCLMLARTTVMRCFWTLCVKTADQWVCPSTATVWLTAHWAKLACWYWGAKLS